MGHKGSVLSVCVSKDNKFLISTSSDNTLIIWSIDNFEIIKILKGHKSKVFTSCITKNGDKIVSGSGDFTIKIW